jgi:hypothetical protein
MSFRRSGDYAAVSRDEGRAVLWKADEVVTEVAVTGAYSRESINFRFWRHGLGAMPTSLPSLLVSSTL